MAKDRSTTVSQTTDPASSAYIARMRAGAQDAAGVATGTPGNFFLGPDSRSIMDQITPFLNPYMSQVVDATRADFDRARGAASVNARDLATRAGAYGGDRHGVAEGVRLGQLDAAEASTLAGLRASGYENALQTGLGYSEYVRGLNERMAQEPIWRQQMANQFLTGGLGPVGTTQTTTEKGSPWGTIAGLGMTAAGLGWAPLAAKGAGAAFTPSGGFTPPPFIPSGGMSGGPGPNPLWPGSTTPWGSLPGPNPLWRG